MSSVINNNPQKKGKGTKLVQKRPQPLVIPSQNSKFKPLRSSRNKGDPVISKTFVGSTPNIGPKSVKAQDNLKQFLFTSQRVKKELATPTRKLDNKDPANILNQISVSSIPYGQSTGLNSMQNLMHGIDSGGELGSLSARDSLLQKSRISSKQKIQSSS